MAVPLILAGAYIGKVAFEGVVGDLAATAVKEIYNIVKETLDIKATQKDIKAINDHMEKYANEVAKVELKRAKGENKGYFQRELDSAKKDLPDVEAAAARLLGLQEALNNAKSSGANDNVIRKLNEELEGAKLVAKWTREQRASDEKAVADQIAAQEEKRKAEEAAKKAYEQRISELKILSAQIKANYGTEEEILKRAYDNDIKEYKSALNAKLISRAVYDDAVAKRTKKYDDDITAQCEKEAEEDKAFWAKIEQDEKNAREQIWRIKEAYATTDDERNAIAIERIKQKYNEELELARKTGVERADIEKAQAAEIEAINNRSKENEKAKDKELQEHKLQLREAYAADEEGRLEIQRERINARYDEQLEKAKEDKDLQIEIERARAAEIKKIEEQIFQARIDSISQYANSMTQMSKDIATLGKAGGNTMKGIAISEATINTSLAATKAMTATPWPLNLVLVAGAITSGMAQVAKIQAQKFAQGGVVGGNSYYGDSVPVMANSGEMILNKEQQKTLLDIASGEQSDNRPQVNVTFAPNIAPGLNSEDVRKMLRENQSMFRSFFANEVSKGLSSAGVFA